MLSLDKPVSVQVGTSAVRVAQIADHRGGFRAVRFAEQDLPADFRWEIGGDYSPLVDALRQALARAGIRSRRGLLLLPRRQVTARVSVLPPSDRQGLRQVVEYDLADHIPFPVDQVVLDFQPLGGSREQPGLTDVMVVAAPRDLVREYLRVMAEAGLHTDAITVDGLALHDLVGLVEREPVGLTVALAIGARASTINVAEGERLRLTRSVASGAHQLVRAIGQDLSLPPEEAQQVKRTDGLHLLLREPRPSATAAWLDNLTGEVRRSALSFGSAPIARAIVADGQAPTPGLREAIQTEFGVEPVLLSAADLFRGAQLTGGDPEAADRCLVAIGGALRAVGRSAWTLSLLPREVVQARRAARVRTAGILTSVAAVAAMTVGYAVAARQVAARSADLPELRRQAQVADERQTVLESLDSERERLRGQLQSLEPEHVRRYAALELLNTMALYAPDDVVLDTFTMRPGQPLEIVGTAPTMAMVVDFQEVLRDSPLVTQVDLDNTTRVLRGGARRPGGAEDGAHVQFTLKARLWTDREPAAGPRTLTTRERSL